MKITLVAALCFCLGLAGFTLGSKPSGEFQVGVNQLVPDKAPTQEEVDMVFNLIQATGKEKGDPNYQMRVIISEEVDAYFLGQKSVDEVADIIQSRMQVYVSENY